MAANGANVGSKGFKANIVDPTLDA